MSDIERINARAVASSIKEMERRIEAQDIMLNALRGLLSAQDARITQLMQQMQQMALIGRGSGPTS